MAEEKVSELLAIMRDAIINTAARPAGRRGPFVFDEDELQEAARRFARTPTPVTEDVGWVMVPKAALDWLNGEAPDPAGMEFGEFTEDYPKPRGAFWWRTVFRQICEFYAAQRPALEDGWQPIETAPKDGTSIDLWVTEKFRAYRVPDAWWGDEDFWTTGRGHSVEGFFDAATGIPLIRAVYWRPLPVSPSIKREA